MEKRTKNILQILAILSDIITISGFIYLLRK
jgi:hypothetical protein